MSNPGDADDTPIASVQQLADHIAAGCKPPADYRIGTEHEKFGFALSTALPPPYAPDGIGALLQGMAAAGAWDPITDAGAVIGLKGQGAHRGASVSLEPAGQLELSGAPVRTLHETEAELAAHFAAVRPVADALGLGFAPLGHHPTLPRQAMPWMPKSRYAIMRRYMPEVGTRGLDMMTRTCTVQVNLDYSSEDDMARKLRVSLALQPVATALFANSPFVEGQAERLPVEPGATSGPTSTTRRSGMPMAFFADGFGFEAYVEWLLDVPMYFVMRDGRYIDVAGQSFRQYMRRGLAGPAGGAGDCRRLRRPHDDGVHRRAGEAVPGDARVGRRAARTMMVAQSALWTGLLYDEASLAAAESLVRRHSWADLFGPAGGGAAAGAERAVRGGDREGPRPGDGGHRERRPARPRDGRSDAGEDERRHLAPLLPLRRRGTDTSGTLAGPLRRPHGPATCRDDLQGRRDLTLP